MSVEPMKNKFYELISKGLTLSMKRMLHEKALHDEDVVMTDAQKNVIRVPAKQLLEQHPEYRL